jgi:SNF2 family DNA or RNA helicase
MMTLRPYQAAFADNGPDRAYLYWQQRLGKSPTALRACPASSLIIVICPAFLKAQWEAEAERWVPDNKVNVYSYEKIPKLEEIKGPYAVIYDEAHFLKTPDSSRTIKAAHLSTRAGRCYLLSGTPSTVNATDWYAQLEILNGRIPTTKGRWAFAYEHCTITKREIRLGGGRTRTICQVGKLKRPTEFAQMLDVSNTFTLTREQVIKDLPKIIGTDIHCGKAVSIKSIVEPGDVHKARIKESESRYETVAADIEGIKAVVFCWYRTTAKAFAESIKAREDVFLCTGDTPPADRTKIIEAWKKSGTGVLIATIASASLGLDFSSAKDCFFLEGVHTEAQMSQARDRLVKIGQTDPISYNYYYSNGGIEKAVFWMARGRRNEVLKVLADLIAS